MSASTVRNWNTRQSNKYLQVLILAAILKHRKENFSVIGDYIFLATGLCKVGVKGSLLKTQSQSKLV